MKVFRSRPWVPAELSCSSPAPRMKRKRGVPPETDFERGLEWLLDGIEAMAKS